MRGRCENSLESSPAFRGCAATVRHRVGQPFRSTTAQLRACPISLLLPGNGFSRECTLSITHPRTRGIFAIRSESFYPRLTECCGWVKVAEARFESCCSATLPQLQSYRVTPVRNPPAFCGESSRRHLQLYFPFTSPTTSSPRPDGIFASHPLQRSASQTCCAGKVTEECRKRGGVLCREREGLDAMKQM